MLKPKQRKAIELLVEAQLTYNEISEELKITPKTLYNWRADEEFAAELSMRLRLKLQGAAPRALKKMEELLEANPMVAHLSAKDLLDRAGYGAESTVNINSEAAVQIIDDIGGGNE